MKDASSGLVLLRSVRVFCANGGYYGRSLTSSVQQRRLYANQRAEDSSASNLGTGEPPIDESQTERGVSRGEASDMRQSTSGGGGSGQVGRHDEPTSTSKFDSGASSSPAASPGAAGGQTKKSRTGSDMSDDGQVHTPHLGKMRTTREMIHDKGKETEDRLARSGAKHT